MTSPLNARPTDRTLPGFAGRRPEWFAVFVTLVYMLPPLTLRLLVPEASSVTADGYPLWFAQLAWTVLVPITLLTVLGWWGLAGFTRCSTRRSLVPFLPLILVYVVLHAVGLPTVLGVASHSIGYFVMVAVSVLAVGFGDEATFRGVVLQALLPRGTLRAVLISSVLFGAQYLSVIASGVDPVLVGAQALHMVGMGIAFGAVLVVTGTIWPLVLINAASLVPFWILPAGDANPGIIGIAVELGLGTLMAAYGLWLLRRHQCRHADRPGENGQ